MYRDYTKRISFQENGILERTMDEKIKDFDNNSQIYFYKG